MCHPGGFGAEILKILVYSFHCAVRPITAFIYYCVTILLK